MATVGLADKAVIELSERVRAALSSLVLVAAPLIAGVTICRKCLARC